MLGDIERLQGETSVREERWGTDVRDNATCESSYGWASLISFTRLLARLRVLGHVHTNPEILKPYILFNRFRVNGALNHSGHSEDAI